MDSLTADNLERNGFDAEAQRAARDAIMEIPAFPELERRLISVLGPTSEALMIHQLVYWFDKPKMQNRWWAYKTYKEWKDERGLNRKQVDKGRKRLKARNLVEEKHGNYKRLHYRVDWVRLAELLSIPLKGGQSYDFEDDDFDDLLDEPLYPPRGGQSSTDTTKGGTVQNDVPLTDDTLDTYAENSSFGGVQSNAREYALAYEQDNSTLQVDAEPAFAEPASPEINKEIELKESSLSSPPIEDKRHSHDSDTSSADIAARKGVEEVQAPPKPDDDTLLADVRKILNPDSGRWWAARIVLDKSYCYAPEVAARHMLLNVGDIEGADAISEAKEEELTQVVAYVMWEATEEGRA